MPVFTFIIHTLFNKCLGKVSFILVNMVGNRCVLEIEVTLPKYVRIKSKLFLLLFSKR
jgi:hypothetical protein